MLMIYILLILQVEAPLIERKSRYRDFKNHYKNLVCSVMIFFL